MTRPGPRNLPILLAVAGLLLVPSTGARPGLPSLPAAGASVAHAVPCRIAQELADRCHGAFPAPIRRASPLVPSAPWTLLPPTARNPNPPAESNFAMSYDGVDQAVIRFGGINATTGNLSGETWEFQNGLWTHLRPALSPIARQGPMMAYDAADGQLVLFGGGNVLGDTVQNDTWWFSHGVWSEHSPKPNATNTPPARYFGSMVYDPASGGIVLFGGCGGYECSVVLGDTWLYRNGSWTNVTPARSPSGRVIAQMTYDGADAAVLLFGGEAASGTILGDTWEFANGSWTALAVSGAPPATAWGWLAYDPYDGYAVLFGGTSGTNATYTLTGRNWTDRSASITVAPTARIGLSDAGVFDPSDGYDVLFGGNYQGQDNNATWIFDASLHALFNASRFAVDQNQSVTLFVQPLAGVGPYHFRYFHLPSGCASRDADNLTCTFGGLGRFPLAVNVTDQVGNHTNRTLNLSVFPDLGGNASVTPSAIDLGAAVNYTLNVTGGSGNLSFAYGPLPPGCGTYSRDPLPCGPTATGAFVTNASVTDTSGARLDFVGLSLTVYPALLATLSPKVVAIDLGEAFEVQLNDSGGHGARVANWSGLPPNCPGGNVRTIACRPNTTGSFHLSVRVTDALGTVATPPPTLLLVNATPSIALADDSSAGFAPFTVTLWETPLHGTPPFRIGWSFGDGSAVVDPGPEQVQHTYGSPGTYTVHVWTNDSRGFPANDSIVVDVVGPLSVRLHATPASEVLDTNELLRLLAAVVGGGSPLEYNWTQLPPGCPAVNGPEIDCRPLIAGEYPVTVTVSDPLRERVRDVIALTVQRAPSLVVSATTVPSGCTVPYSVALTARPSDGVGPFRFAWTFGDGTGNGSGASHVHGYTAAGRYVVTVRATDSTNASSNASVLAVVGPTGCPSTFLGVPVTAGGWGLIAIGLAGAIAVVGALVYRRRSRVRGSPSEPPGGGGSTPDGPGDGASEDGTEGPAAGRT